MIIHTINNPLIQFKVLINKLLMPCGRRHFEARQRPVYLLNADVTSTKQFDLKSVDPIQKHVN